jgi:hypothetical protein
VTYRLDLSGCHAKLDRAKGQIDTLRREIAEIWQPYAGGIPIRREYDASDRAVVHRIQELPEIPGHWPLLIGEALHNLRCVGDHLAWQLAIRFHGGKKPPKDQARNAQFPVVRDPKLWAKHRHTQQMLPDDRNWLEKAQPYHPRKPNVRNGLLDLTLLSDHDKHRMVHLVMFAADQVTLQNTIDTYRDCLPDRRLMPDGSFANIRPNMPGVLEPNLEIAREFVIPTGPNPDRDLQTKLTGKIAIESPSSLGLPPEQVFTPVEFLDSCAQGQAALLRHFQPRL